MLLAYRKNPSFCAVGQRVGVHHQTVQRCVERARLLARHAREHGPTAGHECFARLVQGTVCKILGQEEIKPHKVRYYLERRDAAPHPGHLKARTQGTHHGRHRGRQSPSRHPLLVI
jgi:hypothetical protein